MRLQAPTWALLLGACASDGADDGEHAPGRRDPVALLDAEALAPVGAEDDPLASHRPAEVQCPEGAYFSEDGALEVQTGYCNYAALSAPLPSELHPGDELRIVLLHDLLVFDEAAQGHVALLVGDEVVWEKVVAIPAEATVFDERVTVSKAAAAGTPWMLHLHNHGYNAWKLLELELLP
jgi:hypothetical protein